MAEETKSEEQLLAELRTGPILEVADKSEEVINKDTPPADTPPPTVDDKPTDTPPVDKPYYEVHGFKSQEELDSFIANNRVTKEPTYVNEYAKELDAYTKATGDKDPKKFEFYKSIELKDSMTPADYVKLIVDKEILDNPEMEKFRDMRTKSLTEEYLVDMDDNEIGVTDEEKYEKFVKTQALKKEAQGIIADIQTTKEKIANSGLTQAEIEANTQKLEAAKIKATDFVNKASEALKIDITDEKKNEKGESESVLLKSFTFEPEQKDFFKATLNGLITQFGYPEPDSDSAKMAVELAEMATERKYRTQMYKEVIAQTEAQMVKKYKIDVDNPSTLKVPSISDTSDSNLSEEEAIKQARGWSKVN